MIGDNNGDVKHFNIIFNNNTFNYNMAGQSYQQKRKV